MNNLVTGGAGFIGSHLIDRLAADPGSRIVAFDNMHRGRAGNLAGHLAGGRVSLIEGDLRDAEALGRAMEGAEVVYHLGAQSNVMGAVKDVDYSFTTNVVGTYNVLQLARERGVRRVVFTSSREVYGEARYLPVDENHPIGSKNTYGASKVSGEMYCRVFDHLFDLETAVLRLSNVYGPRDRGRVIPLWLDRAREGLDLEVYGGQQVIDFVWIDVVVEALIRAGTGDPLDGPVNVGSGRGTAILDLGRRILELVDTPSQLVLRPARGAEVVRFTADVTRMRERLGIAPPDDPLGGLERLVLGAG